MLTRCKNTILTLPEQCLRCCHQDSESFIDSRGSQVAFTLIRLQVHFPVCVNRTSEARTSGTFTVTCTSTNTCNSVVIKKLLKIVKYLECLTNVYSTASGNVVHSGWCQNCVISLLYAIQISNSYAYSYRFPKNWAASSNSATLGFHL